MTSTDALQTPLHDAHVALGAKMVPFAGYRMPVQYSSILKEHEAVRTKAGLFDVSQMGELELEGPGAQAFVDSLVSNDVAQLDIGRALYTVCCNERGTILDDLIIYRIASEHVRVVCNASNRAKIAGHFAERHAAWTGASCTYRDASDEFSLLALQGPLAADVMQAIEGDEFFAALKPFGVSPGTITLGGASVALEVARTGYTGEDGFELFVKNEHAPALWDAILAAGEVSPIGLGARDTLRLEARLSLYGNEIDETTTPFDAGLGWVVKLDAADFVGKEALVAAKAAGRSRKIVGIEMVERGIARHGYPIVPEGADADAEPIGEVTSGGLAPTLGKNIGLAYVPAEGYRVGSRVGVVIRGKVAHAVIVKTPFTGGPLEVGTS